MYRFESIDLTDYSLLSPFASRVYPLQDANVTFAYGRRYGLVGRNGIGKTTFLKHLAAKACIVPEEPPGEQRGH